MVKTTLLGVVQIRGRTKIALCVHTHPPQYYMTDVCNVEGVRIAAILEESLSMPIDAGQKAISNADALLTYYGEVGNDG